MKKRNRKFYSIVVLIVCFILVITSSIYFVNLRKQKEGNKGYEFLEDKIVVRVWLPKDKLASTRGYQAEKFNEEHKNIYIILGLFDNMDYSNILKTSLAVEKGPDIMLYSFFELIKEKQIENLNNISLDNKHLNSEDYVYYNKIPIGVRMEEQNVKLVWNKEIFKKAGLDENKAPQTWEELLQDTRKIKEKCPDVIPFQFPIKDYQDFKTSIGEPSVTLDSIYTSFWNYNAGKYNFDSAKDILDIYKNMYDEGIINKDFDKKNKNNLRMDFYQGKVAMHLSTFEDKGYFSNIIPLNFEMGISDLPKMDKAHKNKSYYLSNANFLSISSIIEQKSKKEQEAIKEVFQWITSQEVNEEILTTRASISPIVKNMQVKNDIYKEYNDVSNCQVETLDPSIFISRDSKKTIQTCLDAIKGKKTVEESIKDLNSSYEQYCDFTKNNGQIKLDLFKK